MENLVGKLLNDRYQIESLLGKGGMGTVFKAYDRQRSCQVAIKIIGPGLAQGSAFQERLEELKHEAQTGAKLNHPGIVKIYDFGQDQGHPYLVMEFIPGGNLYTILEELKNEQRWLSLAEALQLMSEISTVLGYVHEQGIYHRDIKPENVLFKVELGAKLRCRPVIADLGLAQLAQERLSQDEDMSGTPAYMSPEQALGRVVDARSDVYALGLLLYELLTGEHPFGLGASLSQVKHFHEHNDRETGSSPRPDFPDELPAAVVEILAKALAKEPADRFTTAGQLAQMLVTALNDLPMAVGNKAVALFATQEVGSLFEYYQKTLESERPQVSNSMQITVKDRGTITKKRSREKQAILDNAAKDMPDEERDTLLILTPNNEIRRELLKNDWISLTIGRAEDRDLRLNGLTVSREHARLERDHDNYYITDEGRTEKGSTNGTYLGEQQILGHNREEWRLNEDILLGGYRLRLVRRQVISRPTGAESLGELQIEPDQTQSDSGPKRLRVDSGPIEVSVQPGSSISIAVALTNQSENIVGHYTMSIEGDALVKQWLSFPSEKIKLNPNGKTTINLAFNPPLSPRSRAGAYPFVIHFSHRSEPEQSVALNGTLIVADFHNVQLNLSPTRQEGVKEGNFTLQLHNQSNIDVTLLLEASDSEDGCDYIFEPSRLSLAAGQSRTARLKVKPKRGLLDEDSKLHQFTVTAQAQAVPGLIQKSQGEWKQRKPVFDLELEPTEIQHVTGGQFQVRLKNLIRTDLTILLEANGENPCTFAFAPPEPVKLPAGHTETVTLDVQAGPLPDKFDVDYPFTLKAWPRENDLLSAWESGIWVQIAPAFELTLNPEIYEDEVAGSFSVEINNQSDADLNMKLDAQSITEACQCQFDLSELLVPAQDRRRVHLHLKTEPPLIGAGDIRHHFAVTARPDEAPEVFHQVVGEWLQPSPDFSLELHPRQQSSLTEGQFSIQVTNESNVGLTLELGVVEETAGCRYDFNPPVIALPAHQPETVSLTLRPDIPILRYESRVYLFTVEAKPQEIPEAKRQVEGTWIQNPLNFSLSLQPERQTDLKTGKFRVAARNSGDDDLTIHLEATDPQDICSYIFDKSSVVAVKHQRDVDFVIDFDELIDLQGDRDYFAFNPVEIRVRAQESQYINLDVIASSFTHERWYHPFTITAYATQAPQLSQTVDGSWEQIPPTIELTLAPQRVTSTTEGVYKVDLRNHNDIDFNIQLKAIEPTGRCQFRIDTPQVDVRARQGVTARFVIQPNTPQTPIWHREHHFTIVASLGQNRSITYMTEGLWRQTPPFWVYLVYILLLLVGLLFLVVFIVSIF